MNINFVKTPFTNKPTMSRHHGQIFNKTPNQTYILEKQKQLEAKKSEVRTGAIAPRLAGDFSFVF